MYAAVFKGYKPFPKKDEAKSKDPAAGCDDATMGKDGKKKPAMKEEADAPMLLVPVATYKHEQVRQLGSVASAMGLCN